MPVVLVLNKLQLRFEARENRLGLTFVFGVKIRKVEHTVWNESTL